MSLSRKTKLSFAETEITVSIIKAYPQPAWIIDADDLHICFTNGAAVRAYGYTEEEFLSFCFTDLLHNDDAEAFRQKVSSSEIQFTIATEQRSKSGKFIQGFLFASRIQIAGAVYYQLTLVNSIESISKHQEQENEKDTRFLASLVEQTTDVLTSADMQFRPITWNAAAERIYGLSKEMAIGNDIREFINFQYLDYTREEVRNFILANGEWRGEASFVRSADKKTITLIISFKLMKNGDTNLGYLVNATDITERKEAESRLRESENRFREMADSSPAMIWMTDENNRTTYINKKWLQFTGKELSEEAGWWISLVHQDDRKKADEVYHRALQHKEQAVLTYRLRKADGSYRWVHDTSVPRFLGDGKFIGYIGTVIDIENEKQKQEELLYEATILENVSDIIITTDLEFRIKSWNKIAALYYECSSDDAIGKTMGALVRFTFYGTTIEKAMAELQATGIWKGETSIDMKNGEKKYFLNTIKYVTDQEGNKIGYLAVGRDITDRMLANAKLEKSEEFYRTLIADALDSMILLDAAGKITFCSPQVKNVLGFDIEEVLGKNVFEFVHPEDLNWAFESLQKEVAGNPEIKFIVIRLLKKDGSWLWCMVRGHNLLANPSINSVVVYFHDDTLRKQASEALKQSEKRFRTLIRDLQIGVLLQDAEGNILMSNNAVYTMFNIREEELLNKKIWEFYNQVIHENGKPFEKTERPSYKALITKKLVSNVIMGVWHPGKNDHIWLMLSADPILDEAGNVQHIVSSFADITERKRLDEHLLARQIGHQKQLTQATIDAQERERTEIGKELHDNIGQQLTTIKLFLDLAKTTSADDATQEMVNMALKGVSDVINEIRAMSRSLVPSTLQDLGLVDSISELVESITCTQFLHIEFDYDRFDEDQLPDNQKLTLFRIVQEQMSNIVRHSHAKKASIELLTDQHRLILLIKDDGKGFDDKNTKKGLGFMNIRNRAELFNGKAEITTSPGKGCQVRVSLPFVPIEAQVT